MASYFLRVRTLGRKNGTRVTRAAAYRAGERIHDERSSDVFDFCTRQDVVHKEIVLASEFAHRADMQWACNRETLWNASEHAGQRRNSLLAREVLVLLPPELSHAQRTTLVRTFSQELANKYRIAVDFVVHRPKPGSDPRHHHAHILMTSRELTPEGLGPRSALELSGSERRAKGLGPSKDDYLKIRERWAELTEWLGSTTTSQHIGIEPAVMASEIERLADLEGYLKIASDADWRKVVLQHVAYEEVIRKPMPITTPVPADYPPPTHIQVSSEANAQRKQRRRPRTAKQSAHPPT